MKKNHEEYLIKDGIKYTQDGRQVAMPSGGVILVPDPCGKGFKSEADKQAAKNLVGTNFENLKKTRGWR